MYYRRAHWYALGPAPGEPGPAVIFGHVDTTKRPDVFYRLKDLRRGAEIHVYGKDGDEFIRSSYVRPASTRILIAVIKGRPILNYVRARRILERRD